MKAIYLISIDNSLGLIKSEKTAVVLQSNGQVR